MNRIPSPAGRAWSLSLAPDAPTFAIGQRVTITRGGHRYEETATVRNVRENAFSGELIYVLTLDTGTLLYMPAYCLELA